MPDYENDADIGEDVGEKQVYMQIACSTSCTGFYCFAQKIQLNE
jgi:hypothetical protein